MAKRRILDKLKLTEISGVDNPCQEGARVAIMKRKDDPMDENQTNEMTEMDELSGAVIDLEAQIAHLNKVVEAAQVRPDVIAPTADDFEQTVSEIRKRDACSRTDALAKARRENPQGFENYCAGPVNADFEALVEAEIAKGVSDSVARQRVGLQFPEATAAVITKQGKHPFEKLVDSIMEQDGCTRSVAMARARRKEPTKFASFQEA